MRRSAEPRRIVSLPAAAFAFMLFALAPFTMPGAQMPGQKMPGLVTIQVEQTSHGFKATAGKEILEATVCSDAVIHVVAVPEPLDHQPARPWMLDAQQSCPGAPFTYAQDDPQNEMWSFDKVEPILLTYDKLRYRLMPYIYSLAWKVTSEDYTIQRPLVMDWRTDPNTWNLGDEFMFGPAILVNPVLKANATKRSVYLPAAQTWYDFWSGQPRSAGNIRADAPLNHIPLFVRAGSIIPMGPEIEYATQNLAGPIELRIYRGAAGKFDLYEDAGDGYGYEKGQHSVIPIRWDDRNSSLTIGARQGSYPGMIEHRKFRVVLVASGHGAGEDVTGDPNAELDYDGKELRTPIK